uniref:Uncharacterized protein n=1 Tax=Arundo donax TaxID=35708 RepID=A0A0A9HDY6_ARUDO
MYKQYLDLLFFVSTMILNHFHNDWGCTEFETNIKPL